MPRIWPKVRMRSSCLKVPRFVPPCPPEPVLGGVLRVPGPSSVLRGRDARNRKRRQTGFGPLLEQPDRVFAPPVSTTNTSHAPLSPNAKFARVRGRRLFRIHPLQPGSQSFETGAFQAQPHCCPLRVVRPQRRIKGSHTGLAGFRSKRSDTTCLTTLN